MAEATERNGACHCGTVRFRVRLPDGLKGTRCNCSFCRMRGAVAIGVGTAVFRDPGAPARIRDELVQRYQTCNG